MGEGGRFSDLATNMRTARTPVQVQHVALHGTKIDSHMWQQKLNTHHYAEPAFSGRSGRRALPTFHISWFAISASSTSSFSR